MSCTTSNNNGGTTCDGVVGGDDNDCMICLFPLLGSGDDDFDGSKSPGLGSTTGDEEIGAVFPCGHVFHLTCWKQWNKDKCPVCNQVASLFSKIFISAPGVTKKRGELDSAERLELERYRREERQQRRMLLRDMEKRVEQDPASAHRIMTTMMMVQSRDLRKAERALNESRDECASTNEKLRHVQKELQHANAELSTLQPRAASLQQEVDRLKSTQLQAKSEAAQTREYQQIIQRLEAKLEKAKEKLALKNKQLTRRNKELASKRKLITDSKVVDLLVKDNNISRNHGSNHTSSSKGRRDSNHQKTLEELQRTKKELELLKELDSFTLEESWSSYGHGSSTFHDSFSWNDLAS